MQMQKGESQCDKYTVQVHSNHYLICSSTYINCPPFIDQALNCSIGGLLIIHPIDIRDLIKDLMSEECHDFVWSLLQILQVSTYHLPQPIEKI